ncbi:MAG: LL-diaminopimelate aminotransferase, partial [Prevotellaceae bacterium]|nr:LL-diaminopimelate aminotransferase [Prevotellaceae bacterium]
PYLWVKTPDRANSWEYFDFLLKEKNIVTTPGVGFGVEGNDFIRLSAFGSREHTLEAMHRLT